MRILMITSILPHPRTLSGGALVMYGQLTQLAARHEVTLASFAGMDSVEKRAIDDLRASGIDVHQVWRSQPTGVDLWGRRLRDAGGWLRGDRPLRTLQFFDPSMQHRLDQLLRERQFDLLQVEDNAMGNYHYRTQIPSILTEHEVRSTLPSDRHNGERTTWIQQFFSEAERRRWGKYQPTVWRRFNRIQVFTPRDAAAIQAMTPELAERLRINPFGVEVPKEVDPRCEEPGTVVFVGGFGHWPNVDAALWLGGEIMPMLRAFRPGVRLIIVGSCPTKAVQALASDDIVVTGRVPAVEPFLERAAVVLAPLRSGGGMRVKVLQAMALGKAVVTTSVGAEGIAVAGCQPPLEIANGAEEFARATATLLGTNSMRRTLGRRARAYVTEHYSWAAYGRRLEEMYAELHSMGSVKTRDRS